MSGHIIEGGIYFLLLFTPLAFGGVEAWAQGVIQAVAGIVFIAWAWEGRWPRRARSRSEPAADRGSDRPLRLLWIAIALFVLLVGLQLTPLPPAMIQRLSPEVHALYASTLPGYAEGKDPDLRDLPAWLVKGMAVRIPLEADPDEEKAALHPPAGSPRPVAASSSWRTLSIYPFLTRQRLTLLLSLIALFAAARSHFNTKERLSRLLGVTVFSGLAVSLFGILQKFNWNGRLYWIREGDYIDPFGPFVDRNTYAAFAGTILPVAIGALFSARRRLGNRRVDAVPPLLFHGFAAVAMAGGIFYSLSRGGMISTSFSILVLAALLVHYGRHKSELAVLGGLLAVAASFLIWIGSEKVIERVGTLSQGQRTPTLAHRIVAWRGSMDLIGDHPALGTGLGTFPFSFMRYAPPGRAWWNVAHNEYIELLCDTGMAGGAIFVAGFAAWLLLIWRPGAFRGHTERFAYAGIVSGLAALLLHSAITSNLQVPANSVLLVILGAALIGLASRQGSRKTPALDPGEGSVHMSRGAAP